MTKTEFLGDADVKAMAAWVAARLSRDSTWTHTYADRRTGERWSCRGLVDAFQQYSWNGEAWPATKIELNSYREELRTAVESRSVPAAFKACADVLQWGGVWANNGVYLAKRGDALLNELLHLSAILAADHTPVKADMLAIQGDPESECRMNAGFVKIYSLLLDYCVIYDGRVGASLGLLARQFCLETGRVSLPSKLAFAYGSPKEATNPKAPKTRNPSASGMRFPKLRPDSRFHTEHTMRANWFLREVLALNLGAFSKGEDGFHELAAGLFMVGYDLSDAGAAVKK